MDASGMVTGLLVGTVLCDPHRTVLIAPNLAVPQWQSTAMFLARDAIEMVAQMRGRAGSMLSAGKVIDYTTHVGGAVFGAVYWYLFLRTRPTTGVGLGHHQGRRL